VSFPFDLHSAAVFDSHTSCCACAMPRPCRSESNFSRPRHSAAWAWHGMCELASAVQRWHVGDLPAFGFFRLPRGVPRRLLPEHTNPLNCGTSSSDILSRGLSRRTRHCRGRAGARHGMCDLLRHGMAGERHGRGMACVNKPFLYKT
jgi:hypothetical protein